MTKLKNKKKDQVKRLIKELRAQEMNLKKCMKDGKKKSQKNVIN